MDDKKNTKLGYADLPVDKWNTPMFIAYIYDMHLQRYRTKYVSRNKAMDAGMLRSLINEYGNDAVKRLIDVCFSEYKPSAQYPVLTIGFMKTWMAPRILPRVLRDIEREEARKGLKRDDSEEIIEW